MKGRLWTVPNQITLLRLGFLPLFLILIVYEHYRWALLILVLAGLSDGIDGLLARKLNQKSSIGAYLDPIADKLLLSSSFLIPAFVVADPQVSRHTNCHSEKGCDCEDGRRKAVATPWFSLHQFRSARSE